MACQVVVHSWTFSGLVGAFLDLAIAYLLLCCSAVAFFVGKFLGVFGMSLPCPCNGLFGYPYRGPCLQRLLVDFPTETVSSVQLSVKSKFPFDAILARNDNCQLNFKLVRNRKLNDGGLEFEGEASYSSFSDPRRSQQSLSGSDSIAKFDLKGKGTASQRQRCGLRRRRRGSVDYGKLTSGSYYDHMRSDVRVVHRSPSDPSKIGSELHAHSFHDVQDTDIVPGKTVPDFEANDATDKNKLLYDNATSFEDLKNNIGGGHGFDSQDENVFKILEQALEQEQDARAALCSELEQERIAAATAADEAMAMISRLQEEKASIEIEARQYQRILEEKSAYDAEEMNILKEIIVRREREKHFLEKEVETYRKVLQENEGLESQVDDTQGQNEASFLDYSSVDPMLILQHLSESIDKRGNVQTKSNYPDYASASIEKQTSDVSLVRESSILECNDTKIYEGLQSLEYHSIIQDHLHDVEETSQEIQEKGVLSLDEILYPKLSKSNGSPNHEFLENNTTIDGEQGSNDIICPLQLIVPGSMRTDYGNEKDREHHVHDVHIIDSKCDIGNKSSEKRIDPPSEASNFQRLQSSANNSQRVVQDIDRSCSDIVDRFSSLSGLPNRSVSELRRNSLSAVDQERLKIDSEIGRLRARLIAVQEEKEKLKNSLQRRERGKTELQLLEDIATQLREIRHLTGPEKGARQASLPPLSSKGTSKRRRSRSISVGVDQSAST